MIQDKYAYVQCSKSYAKYYELFSQKYPGMIIKMFALCKALGQVLRLEWGKGQYLLIRRLLFNQKDRKAYKNNKNGSKEMPSD